jgi:hypothetical protein
MNLQRAFVPGFLVAAAVAGGIGWWIWQKQTAIPQVVSMPPAYVMPLDIEKTPETVQVEEAYTAGHHDFHFVSKVEKPTQVGVNWRACRCASVAICLAPEEWKSLPAAELSKRAEDPQLRWTTLEENSENGFTIPPHGRGWIRLNWKADKSSDERFSVDMWLEDPNSPHGFQLSVPVRFIPRVEASWEKDGFHEGYAEIGLLGKDEQRAVPFVFWSTTRKQFSLTTAPASKDPCLIYGEPIPLKPEELEKLSRDGRKALSGYRVEVRVTERTAEAILDLGPYFRILAWKSDVLPEPIMTGITGRVIGEVTLVGSETNKFEVAMNAIHPTEPRKIPFVLKSEDLRLELMPEEEAMPSFLKVEMMDGAQGTVEKPANGPASKTWRIGVSYRPGSDFVGRFPDSGRVGYTSCDLVFKIRTPGAKEYRERRIRIPVTGQVLTK